MLRPGGCSAFEPGLTPPPLFGDWALHRNWGRIGSTGRLVSGHFASEQEAALAMAGSKAHDTATGRSVVVILRPGKTPPDGSSLARSYTE
jgi:WGR domain